MKGRSNISIKNIHKNGERNISQLHWISLKISANQACQRTAKLFMAEFLQNEGKVMLVKVNEIQTFLKYPKPMFISQ